MADSKQSSGFDNLPVGGKLFVFVLLLGVVGAIWYFAFYMGISEDLERAQRQTRELQQQVVEAQERAREFGRLTAALAQREAIDRQNKRVLPESAEIPAFLQDLNRVAELSGLEMRLVEPQPEEAEELYMRLPVQLEVGGRFHQLSKFFYNVSRLDRAINIENISLSDPNDDSSEEIILDVSVLATTFRSGEALEAAQ